MGLRPPFFGMFQEYCELHDAMYNEGGGKKERFRADKRLLADMVGRSTCTWLMVWCFAYYIAVRSFGWLFFNYNKGKEEKKC